MIFRQPITGMMKLQYTWGKVVQNHEKRTNEEL